MYLSRGEATLWGMKAQLSISLANFPLSPAPPRVLLGILKNREHEDLTELIARLALRGPFHLVTGGPWLPDQDSLHRSVRWHTTEVEETLDHLILGHPSTCLQMLDQLTSADSQTHPVLVLDFLHFFYDPDVDLALRLRVLEQCCQCLRQLARSKPVVVLVYHLGVDEYQLFFPVLESVADEIMEVQESDALPASQLSLWGAR